MLIIAPQGGADVSCVVGRAEAADHSDQFFRGPTTEAKVLRSLTGFRVHIMPICLPRSLEAC